MVCAWYGMCGLRVLYAVCKLCVASASHTCCFVWPGPFAYFPVPNLMGTPVVVNVTSSTLPRGAIRGADSCTRAPVLHACTPSTTLVSSALMWYHGSVVLNTPVQRHTLDHHHCRVAQYCFIGAVLCCTYADRAATCSLLLNAAQVPGGAEPSTAFGLATAAFDPLTRVVRVHCIRLPPSAQDNDCVRTVHSPWGIAASLLRVRWYFVGAIL
jgi:hypothetical protein